MRVKHLSLANFRNYETTEVELTAGVTVFLGENGQGKTNLVEAIYYLSTLNSHRASGYLPLIRHGQPTALVRAMACVDDRDALLELELSRDTANRAKINKGKETKPKDLLGYVNAVIFAPEDLDIIRREPSFRRAFIDDLIVQVWPRFAGIFTDYDRVLRQRNTLLKTARQTRAAADALSTLDAWDESLVKFGSQIVAARIDLVNRLNPYLLAAYQAIAVANNDPQILVKSSLNADVSRLAQSDDETDGLETFGITDREEIAEIFRNRIAELRPKELERGITLVGPHRDDLVLMLGPLPAKGYISHGETWSYALALRLASVDVLKQETRTGDPVLILDDVFAELDHGRRERLATLVAGNEQVLITSAEAGVVPESLGAKIYRVQKAVVTSE